MKSGWMQRALFSLFLCIAILYTPGNVHAQSAAEVQSQIDQHNQQIATLQADIARYQQQLDVIGKQKNTLQSTINTLALQQKQLTAQIQVTQNKIGAANLQIIQLTASIGTKESIIASNEAAIAKAVRDISQTESTPLVAQLIGASTVDDAWVAFDQVQQFNRALGSDIANLQTVRTALSNNRDQVSHTKVALLSYKNDLLVQKQSIDANKQAQLDLLAQTKNQESNYQRLLVQKRASEKAFEQELIGLEGQLNLIVHPGSLPKVGSGVLSWPFSLAFMQGCAQRTGVFGNVFCITQYFGNTPFSTNNPQIYNGHGHNAIDIGAPIGTPVLAAMGGVVYATGNTDAVRGCYSFGKWVMLKHGNGLNTMYAHLSQINVSPGDPVAVGQTLGLSGMTGYATGPHLHFGVYATEGTKIMTLGQFRNVTGGACQNAVMPVATLDAYLNPLSYL